MTTVLLLVTYSVGVFTGLLVAWVVTLLGSTEDRR